MAGPSPSSLPVHLPNGAFQCGVIVDSRSYTAPATRPTTSAIAGALGGLWIDALSFVSAVVHTTVHHTIMSLDRVLSTSKPRGSGAPMRGGGWGGRRWECGSRTLMNAR